MQKISFVDKLLVRFRYVAVGMVWVLIILGGRLAVASAGKLNVILIMADDIGYECIGCYGSKKYQTPNIDRMAEQGMRFTHCYAQPLCTPSRVKLMTGCSNVRNYAAFSVLRKDLKTIGQYFSLSGYRTAIAGKWQLYGAEHYSKRFRAKGTLPKDAGFLRSCLWQVDRTGERYHGPLMSIDGNNQQFSKDEYGPDVATNFLVDFIKANREEPFFVYYPMILVHSPFVPTPDSEGNIQKKRTGNFADMVSYMDKLVGQIIKTTNELGISDRTLILFVGDNGTHTKINSPLNGKEIRGGKGLTTDAGTRVPMVAFGAGIVPERQVNENLIDLSDFLPTLLEATEQSIPADLDGQSFWPQLQGKAGSPREWLHCFYCPRPERTDAIQFVRNKRWKLYSDGRMFDVQNDPLEQIILREFQPETPGAQANKLLKSALENFPSEGAALLKFDAPIK